MIDAKLVTKKWAKAVIGLTLSGDLIMMAGKDPAAVDRLYPVLIDMILELATVDLYKLDPNSTNQDFIKDVEHHIWALYNRFRWTVFEGLLVEGMPEPSRIVTAAPGSNLNN